MRGIFALLAVCAPLTAAAVDYRGDLSVLRDAYVMRSGAFTEQSRQAALAEIASLDAGGATLTRAGFLLGIARVTALADNGHDGWHAGDGAWLPERRAPMRYFSFPDALVVARAAPGQHDLIGAQVTAIDGLPVEEVFRRLGALAGGPENYRRCNLGLYLERAELLHAIGVARAPEGYTLSLILPDGAAVAREIAMIPRSSGSRGAEPARLLSGAPYGNEPELGWRGIEGAPNGPLYLRDPDHLFRYVPLPALGAAYIQFRAHSGTDEEPIEAFQTGALARLAADKPVNLVLDLRFDGGGDISKSVDFFPALQAAVPGRIYVIVSRYTFSAGIVAAALVEMSAPDRVTIVGEPVGDRLRFWSEGKHVCLPDSRYCVGMRDGLWDLVHGCAQEPGCYGDQFKVRVPDLDPDLAASPGVGQWLAGTDPALIAIERDLHGD